MRTDNAAFVFLIVLLLAAGGTVWAFAFQPILTRPDTLANLPLRLGAFEGEDLPIEDAVEAMLRADFSLQRAYVHSFGDPVWLYVGYYGTKRGGTPEHTPDVCYWSNGWKIVRDVRVAIPGSKERDAREFVIEQHGQRRLVLFWYRSYRSDAMPTTFRLLWDHLAGRLTDGRADGGLIRLSTIIAGDDVAPARARLNRFAVVLEPELDRIWPEETPTDGFSLDGFDLDAWQMGGTSTH